jgi:hypothetical protein
MMTARPGAQHTIGRSSLALRISVFVGFHVSVLLGVLTFY